MCTTGRKADELDRRAQPAPRTVRTLRPSPWIRALTTTTPWLPQPDSQRPPAAPRQRDTRSLLPRGPDQRWPRDHVPDDPLARPGVAFLGRAAIDETRVRRPVRRHDHVEEVEFQPAAHRGLPASASMSALRTLAGDDTRACARSISALPFARRPKPPPAPG